MKTLKLEITAQNALNELAKKVLAQALPQLQKIVGKKIFTSTDKKTKFFEEFDKEFLNLHKIEPNKIQDMFVSNQLSYLKTAYGKIELKLSICLSGGSHDVRPRTAFAKYLDRTIVIGTSADGQTIDSIGEMDAIIKDYDLNKVINLDVELEKIKEYKAAVEKAEKIKATIQIDKEYYRFID